MQCLLTSRMVAFRASADQGLPRERGRVERVSIRPKNSGHNRSPLILPLSPARPSARPREPTAKHNRAQKGRAGGGAIQTEGGTHKTTWAKCARRPLKHRLKYPLFFRRSQNDRNSPYTRIPIFGPFDSEMTIATEVLVPQKQLFCYHFHVFIRISVLEPR